ncbi:MAG: rod shape-determining protein MreD [Muribaculaceae bacterium]|nr:rod shape-determining protein MreD [Muribaculaceae bacterium]MEE1338151.1 rod shape-determining protein MreD [Muribaculaceae bacterium]
MTKNAIVSAVMFLLMVFLQVVCNRICLFNIAVPFVFVYFILRLPMSLSVNWVMTLSFLIGLVVDIFSNTYGMYAMSSTIIGALRKPIFTLFYPREDEMSNPIPSINTLGVSTYIKYMFTLVLLLCVVIYFIQLFTFYNIGLTIMRIIGSSLLTAVILFGFDSIATTKS